jgi:hypothetical protein
MFESHCEICLESITDPICTRCYLKQVNIWFKDMKINPIIKNFAIEKIKKRLFYETINETECIICKNENVNICFYCFGSITVQILRELNIPNELVESFSSSFNYGLMEKEVN